MVLFFLKDVAVGKSRSVPPEIEIAVGQDGHCLVADQAVLVTVCPAASKAEGRVELYARGPGVLNGPPNHGDARNLLLS
jgi:sulfur relay (sulfurtransferase) complex TusBCD TusD component (DsrE family)